MPMSSDGAGAAGGFQNGAGQAGVTPTSGASGVAGAGVGSPGGTGSGGSAPALGGASAAGGTPAIGTAGAGAQGGSSAQGGNAALGGNSAQAGNTAQAGADPGSDLPPYVPPGYELIYEQTFSEPSSFDELVIANEQEWFHSPEGYVEFTAATYAPPYRSPFSLALINGVSASSFVLEVEMLQTGVGLGHRDMVIAWNVKSPSEFYYAHVSAEHDDVAHHIHIVNLADRAAITDTFTPGFDWGTDVWRTLRVVRDAASGSMDVYDVDNDELVMSATDTTFTTGYFGVGSFDNTGRVRNLRIWSPDGTETAIPFSF
jgi:hypothetical protein